MKITTKLFALLILGTLCQSVHAQSEQTGEQQLQPKQQRTAKLPTNMDPELPKILVTGSLSPEGMERIGEAIEVVDHEQLNRNNAMSIGEALRGELGVSSTYFGPGASRPIIRGQGKERVRVIENGLENGDVSAASTDHAVTNDPLTTERVDILRGPSTLMYGSQAIGGVVNIIDASIAERPVGEPITGRLNLNGGDSATDTLSGAVELKGEADKLNWYFSGFNRDTNDLQIPGFAESAALRELEALEDQDHDDHEGDDHGDEHSDEEEIRGRLDNSDTESFGVKGGLSHVWEDGFVGVAIRHNGSEYGIPGGHSHAHSEEEEGEEEEGDESVRIDLEQTRIETRGAVHLHNESIDSVRFGLSYSDYEHQELEGAEVGTLYERDAFEGRVMVTHHHDDYLEGGVGLQLNYDNLEVAGEEAFLPDTETFNPALFLIEDFSLTEQLVWQIGARYENSNVNPVTQAAENFDLFSTSTGLIWHTQERDYSAAVNISYAQRAPNGAELFAEGVHVAAQIFEQGDNDLDKESSYGTELILRKLKGSTRGSFTAFIQEYQDYINLVADGSSFDDFAVFNYQNTDARFFGIETELEQDLINRGNHFLYLSAGYDFVRAEDTTNNEDLPRITPARTNLALNYSNQKFAAYLENQFVQEQDRTSDFELPTDSYNLLNAGVSYTIEGPSKRDVELYFKATNLTDDEARIHNSFLKDQAPLAGRAFFAGLNYTF